MRTQAHGLTLRYDSFEASQAAERPPSRPRSPRRGPWQHATSPPRPRIQGHPQSAGEFYLARGPLARPLCGASAQEELRLVRDPPRQTGAVTQLRDGIAAFIANNSAEWSRSQTASAATPHSGRDRSPIRLLWILCHYSRHCVDLRRAVRTRLTPHDHCAIKSLYFLLCRTLNGYGQRPSNTVRPLTGMRLPSVAPSAPRLAKCEDNAPCSRCHADY